MTTVSLIPPDGYSHGFIAPEFIPEDKDEYYLREEQAGPRDVRPLRSEEIDRLVKNHNRAESWETVRVSAIFNPDGIRDSSFAGFVRIGTLSHALLEADGLRLPAGITNSRIVNCDIGDEAAVHDVRLASHCIIGDRALLFDIGELRTTPLARFGCGHLKEGEAAKNRLRLRLRNEIGGREALPFEGFIPADACLFANYRDDAAFQRKLVEMTQHAGDCRRGLYGTIGSECVIRHTRTLIDVKIGPSCSIHGADRVSNVTIHSTADEPVTIGDGVVVENGIVGRTCSVLHGAHAANFILGDNSRLDYGVRLVHSVVGENSTIAGGEVQHALIFAGHEQHHSSSFLIAAQVMGQSNGAAGTIIGSNHNSRSVDGEILAGRGFWPALCVSLKHSSRFASFTLIAKGDFPAELDIPLPFSLVANNMAANRLELMPAWWWRHNMYALVRNAGKYAARDARKIKAQHLEFNFLAPDTVEEIFTARGLIERWTALAALRDSPKAAESRSDEDLRLLGRDILINQHPDASPLAQRAFPSPLVERGLKTLEILAENIEKSRRPAVITGAVQGYEAYEEMLRYYAVTTLIDCFAENADLTFTSLASGFTSNRQKLWTNLGGQIAPTEEIDELRREVGAGTIDSWKDVHERYDSLARTYTLEKHRHAWATLCEILGTESPTLEQWKEELDKIIKLQKFVCDEVFRTRKKDDNNHFRQATYRNKEEMGAVITKAEENEFVVQVRRETEEFGRKVEGVRRRG
jgi:hypothetical protein